MKTEAASPPQPAPPKQRRRPRTVEVQLMFDGQGRPAAYDEPFHAWPGDHVLWTSEFEFEVEFQGDTPLERRGPIKGKKRPDGIYEARANVHPKAARDAPYKYDLELTHPDEGPQRVDPNGVIDVDPREA